MAEFGPNSATPHQPPPITLQLHLTHHVALIVLSQRKTIRTRGTNIMQDPYTGDFGDYVKFALLRSLAPRRRLGIAWYKRTGGWVVEHGKTIQYLDDPRQWQHLDQDVFDVLHDIVKSGLRATSRIEAAPLFGGARYANEPLPVDESHLPTRRRWRREWFDRVVAKLSDRSLVFIDPDTGICHNNSFSCGDLATWQYVPMRELRQLELDDRGNRRPVVVYHTLGRTGKHEDQIQSWMRQLDCHYAFHAPSQSIAGQMTGPRVFFILNPDELMVQDLQAFAKDWHTVGHLVPRRD